MPSKSFMLIDEFDKEHMGAKSNNLKILKDGLMSDSKWIFLPESGCVPFKMMEYTLGLNPHIKEKIDKYIDKLQTVKSVKRMNRILYRCKDLTMQIAFDANDKHH